jgi:hypothetical protein
LLSVSRLLALTVLVSTLLGCGIIPLPRSPVSVFPLSAESVSWATALGAAGFGGSELRTQRLHNLRTRLHPVARALVYAHGAEAQWAQDSALALRPEACAGALQVAAASRLECSLLALGDGRAALLVLSAQQECRAETCLEHSWVFLSGHDAPLPLPVRRLSDYRALEALVSAESAPALWFAGFRSYQDPRFAARGAWPITYAAAEPLASFASCTIAPDERELLCRSAAGDVVAIDPMLGLQRLVARLGIEPAAYARAPGQPAFEPVRWTSDGRLAVDVWASRHPLCGGESPCWLTGLLDWPNREPARAQFVRAAER